MNQRILEPIIVVAAGIVVTVILLKKVNDNIEKGRQVRVHTQFISVEFNAKC